MKIGRTRWSMVGVSTWLESKRTWVRLTLEKVLCCSLEGLTLWIPPGLLKNEDKKIFQENGQPKCAKIKFSTKKWYVGGHVRSYLLPIAKPCKLLELMYWSLSMLFFYHLCSDKHEYAILGSITSWCRADKEPTFFVIDFITALCHRMTSDWKFLGEILKFTPCFVLKSVDQTNMTLVWTEVF